MSGALTLEGFDLDAFVAATLAEDLGPDGRDVTSEAVIPADAIFDGVMDSRDAVTLAGLPIAVAFFRALDPDFGDTPEMGWIFATETHGQGLAGEACRAVLDWADANLQPTPIWAIISPDNAPSIRLAERLGFEHRNRSTYHDEPILVLKRPAKG